MAKYEIRQDENNRRKYKIAKQRLTLHWPSMVVCLLVAFLLWLFVAAGGTDPERPDTPGSETSGAAGEPTACAAGEVWCGS